MRAHGNTRSTLPPAVLPWPALSQRVALTATCTQVDSMKTDYPVIIGGQNFGCGSSREHAPVALGASGATVVVAESYARIFFRNCVST